MGANLRLRGGTSTGAERIESGIVGRTRTRLSSVKDPRLDDTTQGPSGRFGHQREEITVPETDPIGWRGVIYGTPVATSDGTPVGTVREVLGSDSEDIFHGLRVSLASGHRDVMVPADDVTALSHEKIETDLSRSAIDALQTYDEVSTYHLASVGWLRKHLGWSKDSASDEEPG
jgi:hypothetical protein